MNDDMINDVSTDELGSMFTSLENDITATTDTFEKEVSELRTELNKDFAAADAAIADFITELGRTDDLDEFDTPIAGTSAQA